MQISSMKVDDITLLLSKTSQLSIYHLLGVYNNETIFSLSIQVKKQGYICQIESEDYRIYQTLGNESSNLWIEKTLNRWEQEGKL